MYAAQIGPKTHAWRTVYCVFHLFLPDIAIETLVPQRLKHHDGLYSLIKRDAVRLKPMSSATRWWSVRSVRITVLFRLRMVRPMPSPQYLWHKLVSRTNLWYAWCNITTVIYMGIVYTCGINDTRVDHCGDIRSCIPQVSPDVLFCGWLGSKHQLTN